MDSNATAEGPPGSSDLQEYLQSAFQHPAGLQTARNLVQAVAKHMLRQSTQHTSSITTFSDASPEVEAILSDILLFRDSQSHADVGGYTTAVGREADAMDIDSIEDLTGNNELMPVGYTAGYTGVWTKRLISEAVSGPSTTHSRQTNTLVVPARNQSSFSSTSHSSLENGHFPRSEPSLPVSTSHNPVSDKSLESEIRSIFGSKTVGSAILQGTESPYRVESPAVQLLNTPSHSYRANRDVQAESFGLLRRDTGNRASHLSDSGWEGERIGRTQVTSPSEANLYGGFFSAQQLLERRPEARAPPFTNTSASRPNNSSQRNSTTPSPSHPLQYAGLANTIKSFLPVNKLSDHKKDNTSEGGTHSHNRIASQSKVTSTNATNSNHARQLSQENLFYSLQSPSPPPNFERQQLPSSPNVTNLSSPNLTDTELDPSDNRMAPRKRKADVDGGVPKLKKAKVVDPSKKTTRKPAKLKEPKLKEPKSDQEKLPQAIFMRILEFTPPSFLSKARLISKSFKGMVDQFDSIFVNCRRENYGWDMPSPPKGLTERQYSDLFGGKGCLEAGCTDTMSSRTHWSWAKRWCQTCWQAKIIREDRALKQYQGQYGRVTLTKLFECIPAGIHDSFLKPHDYNDNLEARSRQAPRLYKYYLITDIPKIISDYEELTPPAFVEDPSLTPDQIASARAGHQILIDGLEEKRNEFFTARKKENDDHMAKVQRIETAVKDKREENRKPNTENREARKALFTRRAEEDLPHIPQEFIKSSKGFKAATRIFRDPGSERGWQTLKPKIEKEWEDDLRKKAEAPPVVEGTLTVDGVDVAMEIDQPAVNEHNPQEPPPALRQRTITDFSSFNMFGNGPPITDLGSSLKQQHRGGSFVAPQHHLGMYTNQTFRTQAHGYADGHYGSLNGFVGVGNNSFANHTSQFHQTMVPNTNGYQPQNTFSAQPYDPYSTPHHPGFQGNRNMSAMSISAMLSGPSRANPNLNFRQP